MSKSKKVLGTIVNVLLWVFVAFSVIITVMVLVSQNSKDDLPAIFGKSLLPIQSNSMSPTFSQGDLIIDRLLTDDEKKELKVGDVITFYDDLDGDGDDEINTHRITVVRETDSNVYYKTKGDNKVSNPIEDVGEISNVDVLGVWTGTKIPVLGAIITFLQSSTGFLIVIVIPLTLFFLYEAYNLINVIMTMKGRKISKEDEEEIKRRAIEEYLKQQNASQPTTDTAGAEPKSDAVFVASENNEEDK